MSLSSLPTSNDNQVGIVPDVSTLLKKCVEAKNDSIFNHCLAELKAVIFQSADLNLSVEYLWYTRSFRGEKRPQNFLQIVMSKFGKNAGEMHEHGEQILEILAQYIFRTLPYINEIELKDYILKKFHLFEARFSADVLISLAIRSIKDHIYIMHKAQVHIMQQGLISNFGLIASPVLVLPVTPTAVITREQKDEKVNEEPPTIRVVRDHDNLRLFFSRKLLPPQHPMRIQKSKPVFPSSSLPIHTM